MTAPDPSRQESAAPQEPGRSRAQLLSTVCHELRTPLTSIIGSTATLLDDSREHNPAEVRRFCTIIAEQAHRMDQLISDLLDTRCIEAGPLVVVPEAELPPYVLGDLEIHYAQRRVSVAGRPVQLTATEYELLRALSRNAARVASGPVRVMRRENASVKKSDIAAQVADKTSVSKGDAEAAVNAVLGTITDALARGEPVSIAGFGTFSVTERAARQGRNPRTGESIEIAASTVPAFKVGKTLRGAVA